MKSQDLRNSILQYAIEGKLVPQDSNEEDAIKLLEKIKKDKEQLIKDKVIKNDKTIPTITNDEIPYELPKSWEWVKLNDICYKINDGTHHTPNYTNEGIPFLSVKDMSQRKLDFSNTKFISEEEHNKLYQRCNPEYGDLLITKVGTTGIPVLVDTHEQFSLFVSVALLKFNQNLVCNKYLFYLIDSPLVSDYSKKQTRGVGNKNLVMKAIKNFIIPLPPLEEQRRIVNKVEELLNMVSQYDKLEIKLTKLNQKFPDNMEKSILQYAMEGKLVPQVPSEGTAQQLLDKLVREKKDLIKNKIISKQLEPLPISKDEIYFDIPHSWEWVRLNQIGGIVSGGTPKSSEPTFWDDEGMIWITPKDMGKNKNMLISNSARKISSLGLEKSSAKLIPKGSIAYSSRAPIGYIKIVEENYTTNQGCKSVVPLVYNKYIYYALKFFTPEIIKNASGTTFKEISGSKFAQTILPLPPENEQHRIVQKIEELLNQTNKLKSF